MPEPTPDPDEARGSRRFLIGIVLGLLLLSGTVTTLNVLADPYGYAGSGLFATAILSDRPIKACLIQRLKQPPALMILGSSRAEKIQPTHIQKRTGLRGFNAAVSSSTPTDAWAFANLLHEKALCIVTALLKPGEEMIVAERLRAVLG